MTSRTYHTIGVIGVRDYKGSLYTNTSYVVRSLEEHLRKEGLKPDDVFVAIGGGKGVEQMVMQWCDSKGIAYRAYPPNIQEFGTRKAFTVRNNHIVSDSNELVVFWDGCIDIISEAIISAAHQAKRAIVLPVV